MSTATCPWLTSLVTVNDGVSACAAAASVVPGWRGCSVLSATPISGGITNAIYCITRGSSADGPSHALVRVFGDGSHVFIDRQADNARVAALAARDLGPSLYGTFSNGRVEEWYPGTRPLLPAEMTQSAVSEAIARAVATLHAGGADLVTAFGSGEPVLWARITSWLAVLDAKQGNRELLRLARSVVASARHLLTEVTGAVWVRAARARSLAAGDSSDILEARIAGAAAARSIVFGHNDLLSGNVLVDMAEEAAPSRVRLIDTEYAAANYLGFEVANHWMECCGFDIDETLYPSAEKRCAFTRAYVRARGIKEPSLPRHAETVAAFAEELAHAAERFRVASHLWWGVWSLVQASQSSNGEFNYEDYGKSRLERAKADVLTLESQLSAAVEAE
jgi:thiamine kinase-like enzyme